MRIYQHKPHSSLWCAFAPCVVVVVDVSRLCVSLTHDPPAQSRLCACTFVSVCLCACVLVTVVGLGWVVLVMVLFGRGWGWCWVVVSICTECVLCVCVLG